MKRLLALRTQTTSAGLTSILLLGTLTTRAQAIAHYHVHIVLRDGSEFQKTYPSAEALNQDVEFRKLQVGRIAQGQLAFHPDEQRHQAFLVEELFAGQRKHSIFQAWDAVAAQRVEQATATLGEAVPNSPLTQERD